MEGTCLGDNAHRLHIRGLGRILGTYICIYTHTHIRTHLGYHPQQSQWSLKQQGSSDGSWTRGRRQILFPPLHPFSCLPSPVVFGKARSVSCISCTVIWLAGEASFSPFSAYPMKSSALLSFTPDGILYGQVLGEACCASQVQERGDGAHGALGRVLLQGLRGTSLCILFIQH